jgi:hypothetical protein
MLGHMYGDFTKLSLVLIGIAIINLMVQVEDAPYSHLLQHLIMLLIFGIGLGLQIATNFANIVGKCGDILFFLYCIDLEIERVHYSNNHNYSTPHSLMVILRKITIKREWKE